jgi:anti-sigma regulatory factor (Ser/Thr protein kinase)
VTAGERLLVTVADESDGRPYTPDQDDERASGRGILLVDALADQWGIDDTPDGKTVWFTIVRDRA